MPKPYPRPTIRLNREPAGYMAYYADDWLGQRVQDLFGTRIIPTAFTDKANPHTVLSIIRANNPDATVTMTGQENRQCDSNTK